MFCNLFINNNMQAQTYRDKQISKYIFDLGIYLRWENDYDIELIKVGVLNGSSSFLKELRNITRNGYDGQIFIEIIEFNSIADIRETHILFAPKSENKRFTNIMNKISGYNTALITEEYPIKKNIMINIIKRGKGYSFEMNVENLKSANITFDNNISVLGGKMISTKALFDESEKNLKAEKRKVKDQQYQINRQKKLIAGQRASISKQEKELEAQKNKLLSQADDIVEQEKRIRQQKAELVIIEENSKKIRDELLRKTADLRKKEDEISKKELVINENAKILENQQKELKNGQKRIDDMNKEIAAQSGTILIYKNIVSIGVIILSIFLIMLFFILRGYRIKQRNNRQLAQQKQEIEEKTIELEAINKELEKLSIVASETSNAVIILDTQGRFEWVNVGFTKMYGYTLEMIKSNFGEYLKEISKRTDIDELIHTCINKQEPVIYESEVETHEGKNKWSQTTLTPIINNQNEVSKLVIIDSDISQIKEAEREIIRQSQQISKQAKELEKQNAELEKLSLVASKTDNSVIIADVNGDIEWVNDGFTRLLGVSFDEFSKEYGTNIFDSSLNKELKPQMKQAINEKRSIIYSAKTVTKSGKALWIQTTMTPILNNNGKLDKYIAIDADITKIKLAEEEITRQKQKITDSIIYAQKIQSAVLPPKEYINQLLPEHFIMFRPKDIVSGDFYWASHKGDKIMIAAADCTGHGVPGGFMSMLGMTFLNEITGKMEEDEISAGKILTQLRESVKSSLRQTGKEGESKDGMDIALCVIDKSTNELQFAGAYNPLLIIRNHVTEVEIINVMADEMPIGIHKDAKSQFTNHKVQLKSGDLCYIFSDGFPDQFGGKNGRKFMAKRFKSMLAIHSDKSMAGQKKIVETAFDKWKGNYRQIDDVLVIGFKIA